MIYRAQCEFQADSLEPQDIVSINPHFKDIGTSSDPTGLAEDLRDGLFTWQGRGNIGIRVKLYDAEADSPNYPKATVVNTYWGVSPVSSNNNRETALCLSFYSDNNVVSKRGRLYVPLFLFSTSPSTWANSAQMTKVADLGPIFASLGGVDVSWIVWSKKNQSEHKVTNYWVDNEWDVVRSRGIKATTRQTYTTGG